MKKVLKIFVIIVGIIIILAIVFFTVDYNRVKRQEKPIFCISNPAGVYLDGGTIEYYGLGYKVIDFNRLGGYDEIKIGSWFMDYNDFAEEYEKEPGLIPVEQREITGLDIESSITINGEDYNTIKNILEGENYNQEMCQGINKYTIKINGGETYFIKSDCNGVVKNEKQAEISDVDLQQLEDVIQKAIKNSKTNDINNNIELQELNMFYDRDFTEKYEDIRKLDENYSSFNAQNDNCFVIGAMVHNDYLYNDFMNNYINTKSAFIRVVQNTVEGDAIISDVKYDSNKGKIYVVVDNSRDKFSSEDDRKITLKEYEKTAEYKYKEHLYWVVYNGEINDEKFNSDNVYILATIN